MVSNQELERVAIDAYNEFYTTHQILFNTNLQEYWFYASRFKEIKLREYRIAHNGYQNTLAIPNQAVKDDRRN